MKKLSFLIWAGALIVGLGLVSPVLTQSGCGPGQFVTGCGCNDPGQTSTPPCASAQMVTDNPALGQMETPTSNTLDIASTVEETLIAFLLF